MIKDGTICLTREDFWSLGLNKCMDSDIGNACLKIVGEAAQRQGRDVHIVNMYVVPTWKNNVDPMVGFPDDLHSRDAVLFPAWSRQEDHANLYLRCYALCLCTNGPFTFTEGPFSRCSGCPGKSLKKFHLTCRLWLTAQQNRRSWWKKQGAQQHLLVSRILSGSEPSKWLGRYKGKSSFQVPVYLDSEEQQDTLFFYFKGVL
ncbi:hypothetical protein SKAU_G00428700 [Synaphobranchus kaupii]|uniref:PWWP domain-containing protein n=1 Tax=Synaphobranchus kaupii TaxID=118154 RepID=A0A9Q1E4K8_SYNKA|nr:hypothetical protein SKAU_G00428700 [Synaphobranchus kaupii]